MHLFYKPYASIILVTVVVGASLSLTGCEKKGCVSGSPDCVVPSPCQDLAFECSNATVEAKIISSVEDIPGGLDALGAIGDILLQNGNISVVIERLDNPNYFSPTGGMITDISTNDDHNDSIAHIEQVTGLLPGDAVAYTSFEFLPNENGVRAVQFKGHLAGNPQHRVATRYEIRACEPGIRIRTELINNGEEDAVWSFGDGFYWSSRSSSPFAPTYGAGFRHPAFSLGSVNDIFREAPFIVGSSSVEPAASYTLVGCNVDALEGFHSAEVSLIGLPRRIVTTNDYDVFERFIGAANGMGVAPAADIALEIRSQLFQEDFIEISGNIVLDGGRDSLGQSIRATVHIYEGKAVDPAGVRIPWTMVHPNSDGQFQARVPADRNYIAEVVAFGRVAAQREFAGGESNLDLGTLSIPAVASIGLNVKLDDAEHDALVFFYPADTETQTATEARWNDFVHANDLCAPLLGAPYGSSPACNKVLVNGETIIDIPPGTYDVFATTGLFSTLGRTRVSLELGEHTDVTFELSRLDLVPDNMLSADFHVHGAKSFDTNIPDVTRVKSFLAAEMDVIAATDHDAIWDYQEAMDELDVGNEIVLLVGLETTGHVLWNFNPEVLYPQVVGHYNFWPLDFDDALPRNGAAYDEVAEPGLLFTKMNSAGLTRAGVIQLNHPWTTGSVGRDFGFPYALGLNLNSSLPVFDDGTAGGIFVRRPMGSSYFNSDHDTQEVMNGTNNDSFLGYRAFWFYLLNQGYLKAGTANSDSHTLEDNVVGTPRTLVYTETTKENFDVAQFNQDVKQGKMIGTNGPLIDATVEGSDGDWLGPSLDVVGIQSNAELKIKVSAAPWVPVEEIRIIVNGEVVARILDGISKPADNLGSDGLVRYESAIALRDLLPQGNSDAWLVLEAGAIMPINADLDCDGVLDTGDNNDDGVVDWRDIDRNDDGVVTDEDLDLNGDGQEDDGRSLDLTQGPVGPLKLPETPEPSDASFDFAAVTPDGYSLSFTNPFILDRNLNGQFDSPGLPDKAASCEVAE
jgi:hypothetical protein